MSLRRHLFRPTLGFPVSDADGKITYGWNGEQCNGNWYATGFMVICLPFILRAALLAYQLSFWRKKIIQVRENRNFWLLLTSDDLLDINMTLTRAPLGYSAERAPLGGADSAPCLTPKRMVVERQEKAANESSQQDES